MAGLEENRSRRVFKDAGASIFTNTRDLAEDAVGSRCTQQARQVQGDRLTRDTGVSRNAVRCNKTSKIGR